MVERNARDECLTPEQRHRVRKETSQPILLALRPALEQLRQGIGAQFDPDCARAFLSLRQRLDMMVESQAMIDTVPDLEMPQESSNYELECAVV